MSHVPRSKADRGVSARPYKQHTGLSTKATRTPPLSLAALDAMLSAVAAALSGEEGEGDCAEVKHEDLRTAKRWIHAERTRRGAPEKPSPRFFTERPAVGTRVVFHRNGEKPPLRGIVIVGDGDEDRRYPERVIVQWDHESARLADSPDGWPSWNDCEPDEDRR